MEISTSEYIYNVTFLSFAVENLAIIRAFPTLLSMSLLAHRTLNSLRCSAVKHDLVTLLIIFIIEATSCAGLT